MPACRVCGGVQGNAVYVASERMYGFGPLPGCATMITLVTHGSTCCVAANVDPAAVEIGTLVRATYIDFPTNDIGPAWTLYAWEPDA